jgi:transporter family protein
MISVVSLVRRSSVIVSFICAAVLFREKNLRAKALDLLIILIGMVFIWIGTAQNF